MKTGIPTNGSMVKNHISFKTGFEYNVIRRTSFLSWFQACQRVLPQQTQQSGDARSVQRGCLATKIGTSKLGNSQVNRQEKVNLAHRNLGQKDQTRATSEENPSSTRKIDASLPELENMRFSNHRYTGKIYQCLQMKLGRSAIGATFSIESYKTNVLV